MVVAKVLSDSKDDLFYTVERHGMSRNDGGTGIKWTCNCPHNSFRGKTCKHIKRVKAKLQGKIELDGEKIVGVELWGCGSTRFLQYP